MCPLSQREQRLFAENLNIDVNNDEDVFSNLDDDNIFISFAHDQSIDDIVVYIWAGKYSISLSHKEFMALYNIFKNKNDINNMIIADGI